MAKKGDSQNQLKLVLVGDSGVGKSNIISRFTKNEFNLQSKTTIGVQFATKVIDIDNRTIKVQIWDTAGQERYRSMASAYYRGAVGALLVYDITRASSFENLEKWLKQLKNYGSQDMVCLMVGNKSDLKQYRSLKCTQNHLSQDQHGEEFAAKHEMMFLQTSAMEGHNIDKAFAVMISGTYSIISEIVKRQKLSDNKPKSPTKKETLQMTKIKNENGKKKEKCCN